MPTEYLKSEELETMGQELIEKHHPHLEDAEMIFLFKNKKNKDGLAIMPTKRGKEVWGTASIISGLNAFLISGAELTGNADKQYCLVLISKPAWDRLPDEHRRALVDHELCHFTFDEETQKVGTRAHDVEEFQVILERYGLWRKNVEQFVNAGRQMPIPFEADAAPQDSVSC